MRGTPPSPDPVTLPIQVQNVFDCLVKEEQMEEDLEQGTEELEVVLEMQWERAKAQKKEKDQGKDEAVPFA